MKPERHIEIMEVVRLVAESSALCRLLKKRDPHGIDYQNNAMLSAATEKLDKALVELESQA